MRLSTGSVQLNVYNQSRFSVHYLLSNCVYVKGSPQPDITWLKNDESVSPWVNIINVEDASTLVIPSSKYSDSGVYTIMAKNSSGQSSFDIQVRVAGKSVIYK